MRACMNSCHSEQMTPEHFHKQFGCECAGPAANHSRCCGHIYLRRDYYIFGSVVAGARRGTGLVYSAQPKVRLTRSHICAAQSNSAQNHCVRTESGLIETREPTPHRLGALRSCQENPFGAIRPARAMQPRFLASATLLDDGFRCRGRLGRHKPPQALLLQAACVSAPRPAIAGKPAVCAHHAMARHH